MKILLQFGSIIILLTSIALILNGFRLKTGIRKTNVFFSILILVLTLKISNSLIFAFTQNQNNFILTISFIGFMWIGPTYYFLIKSLFINEFKFKIKDYLHYFTAILITIIWLNMGNLRSNWHVYHLFNRLALAQYLIYISVAIYMSFNKIDNSKRVNKQLRVINVFFLIIGLVLILGEASGFPEIENTFIYLLFLYVSSLLVYQKGIIFDLSSDKYKKTGLNNDEKKRILKSLLVLMENKKIYKSNTLTLAKLAKELETNIHSLSQVINENLHQTYFEMISYYRISEAELLLSMSADVKVSDVAYEVGYNSLSAFNTAFKKQTGKTPTKYRDEKTNS